METIKGYVSQIRFRNAENGYTVFSFQTDDSEETVVGNFMAISEGEMLKVEGDWVIHKIYDRQFKAVSYESIQPDDELSIIRYLGSGIIKGIGPTLATRIVNEFGKDTFRVIEEEPEMLEKIKGITIRKAQEIGVMMREKRGYRDAMIFLGKYGIGNALAIKIYSFYEDTIYRVLQENPYKLAEDIDGVGFKTVDEIAAKMGVMKDGDYRIQSGVLYTLLLATQQGFMYLPKGVLLEKAAEILEVSREQIEPLITNMAMDRKLLIYGDNIYSPTNYYAEKSCAGMLRNISVDFYGSTGFSEKELNRKIDKIAASNRINLDELQKLAVINAVQNGISIITGGPGTGKTTTIRTLIEFFDKEGYDIALAAPTGRAAKRMTEATGYEARTLHRLLELNGSLGEDRTSAGFERNEDNPLEVDAVIVDEMSMVDVFLFRALLKAIPQGCRLIMVGDANQLPSVGPGQVLRDLIESKCFPVTSLETIYRQEGSGDIVVNAHLINHGEHIKTDNKSKDFFLLERNDASIILTNTVELIQTSLPPYVKTDPWDIQVLTPMRKGNLGVIALNRFLQAKLNPPAPVKKEHPYGDDVFREGDKVMQVKNNYQAEWEIVGKYNIPIDSGMGVFNGDMGKIIKIDDSDSSITVEFEDLRRVVYPYGSLDELELAYAITIHKSQGSEYSAVVMPLISGPRHLMNRNLLYTGVTRAKKCLVIVGSSQTVQNMIDNDEENLRYSGLKDRILEIFAE